MINQNAGTRTDEGAVRQAIADYLERDWNVIPLRDKKPTFGKDELRPHLYQRPDRETVRGWYREGRFGGVGIVTGPTSGIVVLDVDGEEGKALLKKHGHAPTPMVATSKGLHLYFKDPGGNIPTCIRFAPDLDLKARGGYVAAPPTAGREWIIHPGECELADLPEWVIERIRLRGPRAKFEWGEDIPNGERNKRLTSLAGKLRYAGLDARSILSTLEVENQVRCKPPLDDDEVRKIAESVGSYEPGKPPSFPFPFPYSDSNGGNGQKPIEIVQLSQVPRPVGRRPYLVEGVLPERFPTAFYGDGGTAKSTTVLHLVQSLVRGESEWLGHKIARQADALYVDFELDLEEQVRRAYEVANGMGYTTPPDGLHYLNAAGHRVGDVFQQALAFCQEAGIGVVLIDSLGVAMEGDAELSRDVLGFSRYVIDPMRAAGITPLVVDHQSKLQAGERYQNKTMFGSVYKTNTIRSVFQVEVRERVEDGVKLTLRHKKVNFGRLLDPFGALVEWSVDKTTITPEDLTSDELAEEGTLNVADRILHALESGPAFPDELAAAIGAEKATVKSRLSALRKAGKVEDTGEVRDRSHQVRLSLPLLRYSPISNGNGNDGTDALLNEEVF